MTLFRVDFIEDGENVIMRIAGRLKGDSVDVLAGELPSMRRPSRVDLRDLLFADARGVELIRQLRADGAELEEVPQLLSLQLEGSQRQ